MRRELKGENVAQEQVNEILQNTYGWPVDCAPAPNATATALETMTDQVVADKMEAYCRAFTQAPYGYPGTAYEWARFAYFNEGVEYWELNTQIALGLTVETPVPTVPEAKTVSEWWNQQDHNWTRKGDNKLWDENDADSVAWHEKLFAAALTVPPEWTVGTDPVIYQLACREGYIQPGMSGFHAAYASQTPRYADVMGLTAQQYLDNLRAADRGMPRPWPPKTSQNPVPK